MGNIINTLKGILANKNTITILGVLVGVVAIYLVYNSQIQSTTDTITVYYLKQNVSANTQLTEDMLESVTVSSNLTKLDSNLVTNLAQIQTGTGDNRQFYYVNYDHSLSQGQLLSKNDLVSADEKLPSKSYDLKDDEKQFDLKVSLDLTQGNSIAPGNTIDLWVQGKNPDNEIIFTKFIENLRVIDVVDSNWITTAGSDSASPRYLITAVDEELWLLLKKSEMITGYSFKLVPVVKDKAYEEGSKPSLANETIKNIIEANTSYISY